MLHATLPQSGNSTAPELARNITEHTVDLVSCILSTYTEMQADGPHRQKPGYSNAIRNGIQQHLKYLASAILTGRPEIFEQYIGWLKSVETSQHTALPQSCDLLAIMHQHLQPYAKPYDREILDQIISRGLSACVSPPANLRIPDISNKNYSIQNYAPLTKILVAADHRLASEQISNAMDDGADLSCVSVGIIQPAMYEIGHLWQNGKITVTQEHLATSICQNLLAKAYGRSEFAPPRNRKLLLAALEGNFHVLGLRMISDAFEVEGWTVHHLGASTPTADLIKLIDTYQFDLIGLSISMTTQIVQLHKAIEEIRHTIGSRCPPIAVGGLPFVSMPELAADMRADTWFVNAEIARSQASI